MFGRGCDQGGWMGAIVPKVPRHPYEYEYHRHLQLVDVGLFPYKFVI